MGVAFLISLTHKNFSSVSGRVSFLSLWFDSLLTFNHFQQHLRLVSHRFSFCAYERSDLWINYSFQSKMALCVPNVMILGHSFVRRLSGDLEQHFDDRAKSKAPINVKPAAAGRGGGEVGEGRAWGGDLTFFKNLQLNSLPTAKSFQSNTTTFPHPGLHIAVKYPKAGPKKGKIRISPNRTLQSLFTLRCCITKDTCFCYSCNYTF